MDNFKGSKCQSSECEKYAIWLDDVMIYPLAREGDEPNSDMPPDVLAIYEEARTVAPISRKSAAGLLRLALQMLIDELEPGKGNIDTKIGAMVKKGLDPQIQQAMDVVRVVGNEAVHPGTIDLDDDVTLLPILFGLLNIVIEQVISRPKHVQSVFDRLPPAKREAIERRDGATAE